MDAATRADLIDLMACALAAVFHEERRRVKNSNHSRSPPMSPTVSPTIATSASAFRRCCRLIGYGWHCDAVHRMDAYSTDAASLCRGVCSFGAAVYLRWREPNYCSVNALLCRNWNRSSTFRRAARRL